jgi:ketose-bisphosphate aldolase
MHSLKQLLGRATKGHWAIPHFNISNMEMLKGICEAAAQMRSPVMIGTSEGERMFIGLARAIDLVQTYRDEFKLPIFLNADHTKSVSAAKKAIDAGYPSVHIDLSKLPYAQNLKGTAEVVRYARRKNKNISVEGELGYLATDSSKIYKGKVFVDPKSFTKPGEAVKFVRATGVDRLAPAVGNYHGIAANKKEIHYALIAELRRKLPKSVALVLHGGSGSGDAAFRMAVRAGIANVHISTELRIAYTKTLKETIRKNPDEMTPYKLSEPSVAAVKKLGIKFIKLFGSKGKA